MIGKGCDHAEHTCLYKLLKAFAVLLISTKKGYWSIEIANTLKRLSKG